VAVVSASVSVGTSATALSTAGTDDRPGESLQFTTPASPVIYVGGSNVTSSNGYALAVSTEYFYDLQGGETLYAAVASGSTSLPVLRTGA
jgi:hypothetical protein